MLFAWPPFEAFLRGLPPSPALPSFSAFLGATVGATVTAAGIAIARPTLLALINVKIGPAEDTSRWLLAAVRALIEACHNRFAPLAPASYYERALKLLGP